MKLNPWRFSYHLSAIRVAALQDAPFQQPLSDGSLNPHPRLNFSSPAPHIFHSTFALLQQWPNTFFPAGHTIAPCTIPPNTNLYHAHPTGAFPPSPEWLAFDSAMAYAILGTLPDSHLLTFRTTKEVKCLYFDGTSAALAYDGSMDSQMLFLYNNSANTPKDPVFGDCPPWWSPGGNGTDPRGNDTSFVPLYGEYFRAKGLCDFIQEKGLGGLGWGYEGIVRMNEGFELIWCNFSSPSTELISWVNVSAPRLEGLKPPRIRVPKRPSRQLASNLWNHQILTTDLEEPTNYTYIYLRVGDRPFRESAVYEWFRTATNAYGFAGGVPRSGEVRVKIDTCGLFSFYDPAMGDQAHARAMENTNNFNLSSEGHWLGPNKSSDSRNLALQQLGRRRRFQIPKNVSEADGLYMRLAVESRMRATLDKGDENICSGIDWASTAQTVVADYSSPLYDLRALLAGIGSSNLTNGTNARSRMNILRGLAHQFATPYYTYPSNYTNHTLEDAFSDLSLGSLTALELCKNQHTPASTTRLSEAETLTLSSILTVLSGICITLLPVFLSTEILWLQHFNNVTAYPHVIPSFLQTRIKETVTRQLDDVDELMAWLGWTDQWAGCEPGCSMGEVCAIPMWPISIGLGAGFGFDEKEEELWRGGRCVSMEGTLEGIFG